MAILTQILLIFTVFAIIYASFVHNRPKYDEVIGILPDFRKLFRHEEQSLYVKVVVFVPDAHADIVRQAIGEAGAGVVGNYTFCSFSIKGIGRYVPGNGSHPSIGQLGRLEMVDEERIEVACERKHLKKVVDSIKKVHPYEETVIDVYALESVPSSEDVHMPHI